MATTWHASPRPGAPPMGDADTGEIRVPLDLWCVDRPQGQADLVLSRVEAEHVYAHLSRLLNQPRLSHPRTVHPAARGAS
ncbi:hypothetical protein QCN29_25465 [Streptomyces sp. HNM0663]|uniref:Uncharacterized protein n=1 Tax=Streptomyces chengmaiensis TaxID=3040919 RepID=A0ABT6HTP1_9ACTN|nr:hypothetical protein [Streptomyces chengmaiensis]MDH2392070.1 hypothetical protein [Streptomyces chengmaiensis]